jgi:hypothetical protein
MMASLEPFIALRAARLPLYQSADDALLEAAG